jgi:cyclase
MPISKHPSTLSVVLCACFLTGAVVNRALADTALEREELAPGVFLFRAPSSLEFWTATNSVVIVSDADVTVFDSNTRAKTAQAVIAEIHAITSKPVRTLINSHWHMDHWGGNDEYAKAFPGIRIIATAETRNYMARMTSRFFAEEVGVDRARAALAAAVKIGKESDGSPLSREARRRKESEIEEAARFAAEIEAMPRVLPNLVYDDTLTFWSGTREFRLLSVTGDATGSTVLYLPGYKALVMGDVLVSPENGNGPPPWTTNSYAITPWLHSLRICERLDANLIVPGQGPAFRDKGYLKLTGDLFESVIAQVHGALMGGRVTLSEVKAAVDVDAIGRQFTPDSARPSPEFESLVSALVKKVHQESLDGAASAR